MKNKTKKIFAGLGTSIIGLGSTVAVATATTNCSTNSGLTNLLNFQEPTERIQAKSTNVEDIRNQYFQDIRFNSSIFINDLFWKLYSLGVKNEKSSDSELNNLDKTTSLWIRLNAKVDNFSVNENNELSFNFTLDYKFDNSSQPYDANLSNIGKESGISLFDEMYLKATFTNIPIDILFNEAEGEKTENWWNSTFEDRESAENNKNWKVVVNKLNVKKRIGSVDHSLELKDTIFDSENYEVYADEVGGMVSVEDILAYISLENISYLSDIEPNIKK